MVADKRVEAPSNPNERKTNSFPLEELVPWPSLFSTSIELWFILLVYFYLCHWFLSFRWANTDERRHYFGKEDMPAPISNPEVSQRATSMLFQPLKIANGKTSLEHRVIYNPMTRNRGVPLNPLSTPDNPNRIWFPGDLMVTHYGQRATKGGLMITEGIPISLGVSNFLCPSWTALDPTRLPGY